MKIIKSLPWVYYVGNTSEFISEKVGKWMYFFNNKDFISKICEDIVNKEIVGESKHNDAETGVACFYLNCDDIDAHKKVISYFLENNLIQRTKTGRLYNISFKLDKQTIAGEYGEDFHSEIKLSKFINLDTGEWIL